MNHFTIYEGVFVMDECYWFRIKDHALLNRDSFDLEIRNFIQLIKNFDNLRHPLIIELPLLTRSVRHKLHTFQRKNKVYYYSVGDDNKANFRKMRVLCNIDYINELKLDTIIQVPELPQLPELPEEVPEVPELIKNSKTKIVEYLTSIKDLIDKIIIEIV